jgi:hypothetical protein
MKFNQRLIPVFSGLVLAPALLFVGCVEVSRLAVTPLASPANPAAMVPINLTVTNHHQGSVGVTVTGGHKTNPLWKSEVSGEDFSIALVEALKQSALFSSVTNGNPDYRLDVDLVKVITPMAGYTLTVTVVAQWQLVRVRDASVVSDEYITTHFSARVVELANEGAARANIAEGIRRLSELNLEK